jgi:hypothetical protein
LIVQSRIDDSEDYRFQLPVAVFGHERQEHDGGKAFGWGPASLQHRRAVRLRLVNVGAKRGSQLGYPLCLEDGDSRSPLASAVELQNFSDFKAQRGRTVTRVAFYADVVVDALTIPELPDEKAAWSLIETLRMALSEVLDMEREDLQGLVLGQPGSPLKTAVLYDPMPGGSGLLEQALEHWPEVIQRATAILSDCPSRCATSCIDCLQTFRNSFHHPNLDRHRALELLAAHGDTLQPSHPIPPRHASLPANSTADPVNRAERRLRAKLEAAGLHGSLPQQRLHLGAPHGSTTPDFLFPLETQEEPGVAIYLDGLSTHIHGNAKTQARDYAIRTELRRRGYEVIEIPATHLDDRDALRTHFFKIAKSLIGKQEATRLLASNPWHHAEPTE